MSEKVKVPNDFAVWLQRRPLEVIYQNGFEINTFEEIIKIYRNRGVVSDSLRDWIRANFYTAVKAVIDGYEIEGPKYTATLTFGDDKIGSFQISENEWEKIKKSAIDPKDKKHRHGGIIK